jgi:ABC-type uncharacterized transport system ATPase subunit
VTALVASEITKVYGGLLANDAISLTLERGHVHALLGENGAGKSTLIGVLTGRVRPDQGSVLVEGRAVALGQPDAASAAGVTAVFQDLLLVPSMTGLENLALALGRAPNAATRADIAAVQAEYALEAPLDIHVRELELPMRQRLELVRALATRPSVLLLDEPTTYLPPTAVDRFLGEVRGIAQGGVSVLLITHRLAEARAVADRLTILRQGRVVAGHTREALPSDGEIARQMVGDGLHEPTIDPTAPGEVILSCQGLQAVDERGAAVLRGIDLDVRRGEIVGLAGVDGNGQQPLLEALAGIRSTTAGTVRFNGEVVTGEVYLRRSRRGIRFVSGDRRRHGVIPTLDVGEHFELVHGPDIHSRIHEILRSIGLTPSDPRHPVEKLSGGNQQKVLLGRALEGGCRVLLVAYPTQGLDVRARLAVHQLLLTARANGLAVVFSSTDLDELFALSDRVLALNRGRINGSQSRDRFDQHVLAEWFITEQAGASEQAMV